MSWQTLVLLVFAVCSSAVYCQVPEKCVAPPLFEGRASQMNHETQSFSRFRIHYDATNRRKAVFQEKDHVYPGRKFYMYIMLYNENIQYTVDLVSRDCTKSVPLPWLPYGIPENATFESEYYIGGPNQELLVTEWSDRGRYVTMETFVIVQSVNDCLPVRVTEINTHSVSDTYSTYYYGITLGNSDPTVFIPPEECRNATIGHDERVKLP